jgi:hypothetical protein
MAFYQEFKVKVRIMQKKTWELQFEAKEALKCVLYK